MHKRENASSAKKRRPKRRLWNWVSMCFWLLIIAVIGYGLLRQIGSTKQNRNQLVSAFWDEVAPKKADVPAAAGENATDKTAWNLILVNREHPIPDDYQVELITLSGGESVDSRIVLALQKMFDDAQADGVYPIVASGYRTADEQQRLMDGKIADYKREGFSPSEAKSKAEAWVAVPGTSEHQLGISVDINADGIHSKGEEVYRWLSKNGYKYGFVQRYPTDKTEVTGTIYEPWHYRYVGQEAAAQMHRQGLCLEEYLRTLEQE